ncbi:hypothetical protein [Streptomyces sp. SID12488]|uniref:hypothetical protein n=1 Tax=Streptomyces sp. SID12488 TaxID=2706040 RepID=UPI0023B2CE7B|nr:hypothetical protein [Streptomyces sp. SID12488]
MNRPFPPRRRYEDGPVHADPPVFSGRGRCGAPSSAATDPVTPAPTPARVRARNRDTATPARHSPPPATAGLVAGVTGVAAPFVMLGALLLLAAGTVIRSEAEAEAAPERRRSLLQRRWR